MLDSERFEKMMFMWLKEWSQLSDSNRRPADYKSTALPTELSWHHFFNELLNYC